MRLLTKRNLLAWTPKHYLKNSENIICQSYCKHFCIKVRLGLRNMLDSVIVFLCPVGFNNFFQSLCPVFTAAFFGVALNTIYCMSRKKDSKQDESLIRIFSEHFTHFMMITTVRLLYPKSTQLSGSREDTRTHEAI